MLTQNFFVLQWQYFPVHVFWENELSCLVASPEPKKFSLFVHCAQESVVPTHDCPSGPEKEFS